MIIVIGSAVINGGEFEKALALSHEHVRRSRAEPGCLLHSVHQDTENPNRLVFVEQWEDGPALRTHFNVPESRAFGKALAALSVELPTMSVHEATPVKV